MNNTKNNVEGKSVIIASSHVWGSELKLGTHHIAEQFIKAGWRVLFLSSPLSALHLLHPIGRTRAIHKWRMRKPINLPDSEGCVLYCPFTLLPHVNQWPLSMDWILDNWKHMTVPNVRQQISQTGFDDPDVIYFDSVVFWPLLKQFPGKTVYRVADRIDRFPVVTPAILEMHKQAIEEVDLLVYTARNLEDQIEQRIGKRLYLPNGVDFAVFSKPAAKPIEYNQGGGPIALYVGAIEEWFDFQAFNDATETLPSVRFFLIGPHSAHSQKITARNNVFQLGPRPHGDLPAYVQNADVGLIPFDTRSAKELVDSVCPLKLFEYLAGGLATISYCGKEVEKLQAPITIYSGKKTLAMTIEDVLYSRQLMHNTAKLNHFAQQADWQIRFETMLEAIGATNLSVM
jgi:Glucuronosyltransferase GumK, N-terminal domain